MGAVSRAGLRWRRLCTLYREENGQEGAYQDAKQWLENQVALRFVREVRAYELIDFALAHLPVVEERDGDRGPPFHGLGRNGDRGSLLALDPHGLLRALDRVARPDNAARRRPDTEEEREGCCEPRRARAARPSFRVSERRHAHTAGGRTTRARPRPHDRSSLRPEAMCDGCARGATSRGLATVSRGGACASDGWGAGRDHGA